MLVFSQVPVLVEPHKRVSRLGNIRPGAEISYNLQSRTLFRKSHCTLKRATFGLRWTSRYRLTVLAQKGPGSADSTIKSLESILGSADSLVEPGTEPGGSSRDDDVPRHRRKIPDAAERRVRPLYVYVIYYCFIVVYLATAWLQATDGDLAASILVDGLVNDHLAVASGQIPRLATAGFVCGGPLELFLQLATLLTVGAEAEALLGYSLFWAVYWLSSLGGGFADSVLSELPITYGPANAAAGMVGALVAYYILNLGLEERIKAARKSVRRRRQQILDGVGRGSDKEEAWLATSSREDLEETDTEVEVLPMLSFKFSVKMSPTAKSLLNVLVALVVAGQGLLDFGGASSSASWIGLIAAFWTGLLLTLGAGPQYEVQYMLPEYPLEANGTVGDDDQAGGSKATAENSSSSAGSSNPSLERQNSATTRESGEGFPVAAARRGRDPGGPVPDDDGLTVVDVCPPSRRQAVLGGYMAGLAAFIVGWLAWMGTDI